MAELRVYLKIESLRRQFAAYMGSPTRGRGYVPLEGTHSLIVEIAPATSPNSWTTWSRSDVSPTTIPKTRIVMIRTNSAETTAPESSAHKRKRVFIALRSISLR